MDNADYAQDLIDKRMADALALRRAAAQGKGMQGPSECDDCGEEIPTARRLRLPGVATCVECQAIREQRKRGWR